MLDNADCSDLLKRSVLSSDFSSTLFHSIVPGTRYGPMESGERVGERESIYDCRLLVTVVEALVSSAFVVGA